MKNDGHTLSVIGRLAFLKMAGVTCPATGWLCATISAAISTTTNATDRSETHSCTGANAAAVSSYKYTNTHTIKWGTAFSQKSIVRHKSNAGIGFLDFHNLMSGCLNFTSWWEEMQAVGVVNSNYIDFSSLSIALLFFY